MNTLHFRYAVEVERTGSISQAAENLFMAQPNLSKAIHELEDTLGITIFERTSRGVIPTDQGKEFLSYAKNILLELDKMKAIYIPPEKRKDIQQTKVSIPRGSYISTSVALFVDSLDPEKDIIVNLRETNSIETVINVAENNYNFGIIRYQAVNEKYFIDFLREKQLEHELLWEFECKVLMNAGHEMANDDVLDYEKLKKTSIEIVHGDNVIPYVSVPEVKSPEESDGKRIKKVYVYERGSQFELLKNCKRTFMWVSPMPRETLETIGLVEKKCAMENNCFKDVIIRRKGYKFSETDTKLLNKIYEKRNEIAFSL
ncbi:MAG: LysR family transcriptional regulator [Eubacteriales bacterium]